MSIRNISVAVRAHAEIIQKNEDQENKNNRNKKPKDKQNLFLPYGKRILVFDTETTDDIYMNLRYGQAFIIEGTDHAWEDGRVEKNGHILFYGENISSEEMETLKIWAKKKRALLMTRQKFVDDIFLREILIIGTICVGFNLTFDLPRLAVKVKTQEHGKNKDKFELVLSENKYTPSILLEPLDSKKSFISIKFPTMPKMQNIRKYQGDGKQDGRFLDLRTLVFALTSESYNLSSACKLYQTAKRKTEADEGGYGIISFENLNYNYNDVDCTALLYKKVMEEYYRHPIAETLEAGKAYSPASIGKAYYQVMGIKPLAEIQPDFPKEVLGYAMASYYGGRAECHYRGIPVKCFHTDVLSMYPSVFVLQGLWQWVIASGFDYRENTDEVKEFLEVISLETLFRQETWVSVPGLVLVKPDKDLLPVRAEYNDDTYQIGLNYLTSETPLWYTLADIVACKILTGKTPEIIKTLKIIPKEPQSDLKQTNLRGQVEINPANDDFFKRVIELRDLHKKQIKEKGDEADSLQTFLKTLANSTNYGIYAELNRDEAKEELEIEVYGTNTSKYKSKDYEKPGKIYNPLIATMIPSAARLILAMIQKSIENLGGSYAFCDTDSMNIIDLVNDKPEVIGRQVIEKFQSLVPYDFENDFGRSLLQAEKVNWKLDHPNEYQDLYCYAVASKRYVFYNLIPMEDGKTEVVIRKVSKHGLGHLKPPAGLKNIEELVTEIWKMNICREHGLPYTRPPWFSDVALARQSISKPSILKLFNREKGISYERMIKPGNFFLVGYSADTLLNIGSQLIEEFYCKKYQSVGMNNCRNKSSCEYKQECLANLHVIAVTPYTKDKHWQELEWIDKTTKNPVKVKVYREFSDTNPPQYDVTYLKPYSSFIENYHLHPEVKFDDSQGNAGSKQTKGLLQPCEVEAKKIIPIGKETNTIGSEEDLAILPEEQLEDKRLLQYEQQKERIKKFEIDVKQWEALRVILKEQAKPRMKWVEALGISKRYLQELLTGKYLPSPGLYENILTICKVENINIPDSKLPLPARIDSDTRGYIYSLHDLIKRLQVTESIVREALIDYIFELNNVTLVNCSSEECQKLIDNLYIRYQEEQEMQKINSIVNLKIIGTIRNKKSKEYFKIEISPDEVGTIQFTAKKLIGRNRLTLQMWDVDWEVTVNILQCDNELAFKLGLLPKASKFKINPEINFKTPDGKIYQWSYCSDDSLQWVPLAKIKTHYHLNPQQLLDDVKNGKFPAEMIKHEGKKIYVEAWTAWKVYSKTIPDRVQAFEEKDKPSANLISQWRGEINFSAYEQQQEKYQARYERSFSQISNKTVKKSLRKAIIELGGVNDGDYEYLPKWCKRKAGHPLDELVGELAGMGFHYESANELYEAILAG